MKCNELKVVWELSFKIKPLEDSTNINEGKGKERILKFESWSKKEKTFQFLRKWKEKNIKFRSGNGRKKSGNEGTPKDYRGIWLWINDWNWQIRWTQNGSSSKQVYCTTQKKKSLSLWVHEYNSVSFIDEKEGGGGSKNIWRDFSAPFFNRDCAFLDPSMTQKNVPFYWLIVCLNKLMIIFHLLSTLIINLFPTLECLTKQCLS